MKRFSVLSASLLISILTYAQEGIGYFLPHDITYNPEIPTPKEFTGHEIGEWHLTHDKLYFYMLELARISDRAVWEEYGRSYENRPLGQLIISSPDNLKQLDKLREQHLKLCDPNVSDELDISKMPLFINLGYGVHGNESSAQNASAVVAYYLLAGQGNALDELLGKTVILIDPALNPDGMQRHSTWVNMTRSLNNNPDINSWEFSEPWPGGRTNHYWFDLNRDYIMLQHPETVGRVASFYKWRPNINTDHHEMEANSTFFFQPGIQSRNNPLVPIENQILTAEIGKYHEKYLNRIGSLYYTEESYDDFYVGKGSAYPDIHGSVGILFEQAGTKGHLRETPSGILTFPFAIRNQFTVSLSSIEAGLRMKDKLLESQRKFYKEALKAADSHPVKAYVFSEPDDNGRISYFINNLIRHHIRIFRLAKDVSRSGITYKSSESYIIPLKQNEFRFIRSLFEPVKDFTDSTFYDISTWILPMSFNIPFTAITTMKELDGLTGIEITSAPSVTGKLEGPAVPYAYLFEWKEYFTPRALYSIQDAGLSARVSTKEFLYDDGSFRKKFGYGTILIPVNGQKRKGEDIRSLLQKTAEDCGITIYGVSTGLTAEGIDLGSNAFTILEKPSVLMIAGDGINSGDAGEIWHMFDTRFRIPLTMMRGERMGSVDPGRYNVLIIAGSPDLSQQAVAKIREWNRNGGTIIGYKGGNNWLVRNKIIETEFKPEAENRKKEGRYIDRPVDNQVQLIAGSIFETKLDLTHPLCYGYTRPLLPVMKSGASAAVKNANIYNNPVIYTESPLLSGYCTKENLDRIKGTAFASINGNGIVSIYDNTNFRAIWFGTSKIFMNAVFFGPLMR
jgi:hypothetical protein